MPQVRAKFTVTKVSKVSWNPSMVEVELSPVCADGIPENERFHKYTPAGTLRMSIDNPPAADVFLLGASFYVDFTPVEAPKA